MTKVGKTFILLATFLLIASGTAYGQHFQFDDEDRAAHNIVIRGATLDDEALADDDEIGVFTPDGICAGAAIISGEPNYGLTAYSDKPATEEVEGFLDGEAFAFRIWDATAETEVNASFNIANGDEEWHSFGFTTLERVFAFSEPVAVISLSPAVLEFGEVLLDDSRDLILTISNIGFADLVVSDISSDDGAFVPDFGDDLVVEPDTSVEVTITFTPDAAEDFAATLSVTSNDAEDDVATVDLTGAGTEDAFATIVLSREHIEWEEFPVDASKTKALHITNTGTTDLTITSFTIDNEVYTSDWNGEDVVIVPHENFDLMVTFNPADTAEYDGALTIESDALDNESIDVTLHGIGVPRQGHFAFQRTNFNHSILVLAATIDDELLVAGDEIGVFTPDGLCAGAVVLSDRDPDAEEWFNRFGAGLGAMFDDRETEELDGFLPNDQFEFRLWDLTDGEEYETQLEFESGPERWTQNGVTEIFLAAAREQEPNIALTPEVMDFRGVFVRDTVDLTLRVYNSGFADLRVSNMEMSETDYFSFEFEAGFVVEPREEKLFDVTFIPDDAADYEAVITVTSNDEDEGVLEYQILGSGLAPLPELLVAEEDLAHQFGTVNIRQVGIWELNITNNGWLDLVIDDVEFTNPVFSSDLQDGGITVAGGEDFLLTVSFTPDEAIDYDETMSIFSNHMNEDDYEHIFEITGTGDFQPDIELDPTDLDFGDVDIRAEFAEGDELLLTISNVGSGDLVVSDITLDGEAFTYDFEAEFTLTPDQSYELMVFFDPEELIEYEGLLIISSNDQDFAELRVTIVGNGIYINHAPILPDPEDQEQDEDFDAYVIVNLDDISSDADGDELTYIAVADNEGVIVTVDEENNLILDTEQDWNGEAVVTVTADDGFDDEEEQRDSGPVRTRRLLRQTFQPTGRSLRSTSGLPSFNPFRDATGEGQFSVTVNAVNDQPLWVDYPESMNGGEAVEMEFVVTAEDVDLDALTLSYLSDDIPEAAMFVDNGDGTGTFSWEPSFELVSVEEDSRSFTASFTVTDGELSDNIDVPITITHVNRPPVWIQDPQDVEVDEGDIVEIDMNGEDPDGNDVTITYRSDDLPEDVSFEDNGDGTASFAWETDHLDAGEYSAFFTIEDAQYRVTRAISITINNVNRAPVWVEAPEAIEAEEGDEITFEVVASDPDNDRLTLTMNSDDLPEEADFIDRRNRTGRFTWNTTFQDAGEYTATLIASDGEFSDTAVVSITVSDFNRAPEWTDIPNSIHVNPGAKAEFNMYGDDEDNDDLTINYVSENIPDAAVFEDNGDGTAGFSWRTGNEHDGNSYEAFFTLTDGVDSVTHRVIITVGEGNQPPDYDAIPDVLRLNETSTVEFSIEASDPNDDDLTLTMASDDLPDDAVFEDNGDGTGDFIWETTYDDAGEYSAVFTLSDGVYEIPATVEIIINNVNRAPIWIDIPEYVEVSELELIEFSISAEDPDGENISITFESNTMPEDFVFIDNLDGTADFSWRTSYEDAGDYIGTFIASDDEDEVVGDVQIVVLNVNRDPFWVDVPENAEVDEGALLRFRVTAGDEDIEDIDNLELTFNNEEMPDGVTLSDFGDGTGFFAWEPGYDEAGEYTAILTVTDLDGLTDDTEIAITVNHVNRTPIFVVRPNSEVSVGEGENYSARIVGNDPDGDRLTITLPPGDLPDEYEFADAGDGTAQFSWTPGYEDSGEYTLTYTLSDGDFEITTETVLTVIHTNRPPVWDEVPVAVEVNETEELVINVTGSDPDRDGVTISYSSEDIPDNAEFVDNNDGSASLTWTPNFDESGDYTAIFTINDDVEENGFETTTEVGITVNQTNRSPEWDDFPEDALAVDEDDLLEFSVTGSDPDGDLLYIDYDLPDGAEFTDNGDGTGDFSWMPDFEQAGDYTVTLYLSDDIAEDVEITVDITVGDVNRAPLIVMYPDEEIEADEDEPITFDVEAIDPDGDDISWELTESDLPEGFDFRDIGDGTGNFQWTPTYDDVSADDELANFTATFEVTDGALNASIDVGLTIYHVNREPDWTDEVGNRVEAEENEEVSFTVTGADPDGDDLSIAYESDDLPDNVEYVDNGDGTGTFTWTPDFDESRNYTAVFYLSDDEFVLSARRVRVIVNHVNRGPVWSDVPDSLWVNEGDNLEFSVVGEDPDNDFLTIDYNVDDFPNRVSVRDLGDGRATFIWRTNYVDAGIIKAYFTLADDDASILDSVYIEVIENMGPVVADDIGDLFVQEDFVRFQVADLAEVFSDNEDDELSYFEDWDEGIINVELTNDGILYISAIANEFGASTVWITASDQHSSVTDSFEVIVAEVLDPPEIDPDKQPDPDIEVDEDGGLQIIADLDTVFFDPEDDPLFFWTEGGEHLNPNIDEENVLSFHPDEDWSGVESFIVWADDEEPAMSPNTPEGGTPRRDEGTSFVINVTIENVNDPPKIGVAVDDQTLNEDEGPWMIADLDFVLVDPDGDELAFTVEIDAPLEATIDDDTHELIVTAPENYFSDASLNVMITANDIVHDTTGEYAFVIDILAVNDLPTVDVALSDMTVDEDSGPWTVADLDTIFSDLDDEVLTFTVETEDDVEWAVDEDNVLTLTVPDNFSSDGINLSVIADDGHDAVTAFSSRRSMRSTNGALPQRDVAVATEFMLAVTALNDPPTITSSPDPIEVDEMEIIEFNITFTDLDFTYEGDHLTVEMSSDGGLPDDVRFYDNRDNTGSFEWTPTQDQAGDYSPEFTVTDNAGEMAMVVVTISVGNVNRDPAGIAVIGNRVIDEDAGTVVLTNLNTNFADPDADALTFTLVVSDAMVTAEVGAGGDLMVTPTENWHGSVTIDVTADDGVGTPATDSFNLIVSPVNDLPDAFGLISPTDGWKTHDFPKVEFTWMPTVDPVEDSTITYAVAIYFNDRTMWFRDLDATNFLIDRSRIALEPNNDTELEWEIWAYDGVDSLISTDRFNLTIAPLTEQERNLLLMPVEVQLGPLYPNPFNSVITIEFGLPEAYIAEVNVYDISGRLVKKLVNELLSAGHHMVTWNGMNEADFGVSAGIYIVRITTPESVKLQQIILMK